MLPACAEKACLLLSLIIYTITQVSGLTGLKNLAQVTFLVVKMNRMTIYL